MNLLIDIGNSRLKWAVSDQDNWQTGSEQVSGSGLSVILDNIWQDVARPDKIVIASVVDPDRASQIGEWLRSRWSLSPIWVTAQKQQLGVTNCYQNPETLGADRWAALIAARNLTPKSAIVIDCGTAVTVDFLSDDGKFNGGVIFPGLSMLRKSLVTGTSNIQQHEADDSVMPACNTEQGVAAGTLQGWLGAIQHVVDNYRVKFGKEAEVIVTGGDVDKFISGLPAVAQVGARRVPDLVLKGLALIADES